MAIVQGVSRTANFASVQFEFVWLGRWRNVGPKDAMAGFISFIQHPKRYYRSGAVEKEIETAKAYCLALDRFESLCRDEVSFTHLPEAEISQPHWICRSGQRSTLGAHLDLVVAGDYQSPSPGKVWEDLRHILLKYRGYFRYIQDQRHEFVRPAWLSDVINIIDAFIAASWQ